MPEYALITGATGGIGRAIASEFVARGFNVVVTGRSFEQLESLRSALINGTCQIQAITADLAQREDVEQLFEKIDSSMGELRFLVLNAGVLNRGPLQDQVQRIDNSLEVNLRSPIQLTAEARPLLAAHRGSVVFVASTAGRVAFPYVSLYCATKHGLVGFAESIRYELEEQGIHVMVAFPPMTATDMTAAMARAAGRWRPRLADPEKVGGQIVAACLNRKRVHWGSWSDRFLDCINRWFPVPTRWGFRLFKGMFRRVMLQRVNLDERREGERGEGERQED